MSTVGNNQWVRRVGLFILKTGSSSIAPETAIDLSEFRIKFDISNADVESPSSCVIRVYNLSKLTVKTLAGKGEYTELVLNAGYVNGNYGTIFKGSIKQFRIGRENAMDTYLDIFVADGDVGYNQGIVNTSLARGVTTAQAASTVINTMPGLGADFGSLTTTKQFTPSIRGVVLMGMARARLRNLVTHLDSGWSIQDGKVVVTDNTGYRDGEAVDINVATGLIGMPEQTDGGIRIQCLLNSRIRIGNRIKLNNDEIIQLLQSTPSAAPIPYNQWAGFQFVAPLNPDGVYRAFTVEHHGDTRSQAWYTAMTCLSVNESVPQSQSVGAN